MFQHGKLYPTISRQCVDVRETGCLFGALTVESKRHITVLICESSMSIRLLFTGFAAALGRILSAAVPSEGACQPCESLP